MALLNLPRQRQRRVLLQKHGKVIVSGDNGYAQAMASAGGEPTRGRQQRR